MPGGSYGSMEWSTESTSVDGYELVTIVGDFDLYSAPEFFAVFSRHLEEGSRSLRFDFSGVSYLDSSGVGAIIKLLQTSRRVGGKLRFRGISGSPRKVLGMSNILPLLVEDPPETAR